MPRQPRSAVRATPEQSLQVRRHIAYLEALGMTRSAIAQRAGVSPSAVTKICAGTVAMSRTTAMAVLAVRR